MTIPRVTHMSLKAALRSAASKELEYGWLYLPNAENPSLETPCLLISGYEEDSHLVAAANGFPKDGLDTEDLEETANCARLFQDPPRDDLLLESFIYYWRFDAWLPGPGAPEPPSQEETQRQYYEMLGVERQGVPCRKESCSRGAISNSVLCRVHHFEMIRKIPCPFHHWPRRLTLPSRGTSKGYRPRPPLMSNVRIKLTNINQPICKTLIQDWHLLC